MTLLNRAGRIYIGGAAASAAYVGSTLVWSAFRPTDIAGCRVWLDAAQLNLADGAAVSSWANFGAGPQPVIAAGATFRERGLSGMPVVRITQGSGKIRFTGTGVDKDWTVIYVGRRWQLGRPGRVVTASGTAANLLVGFHGNEMDQCFVEGWLSSGVAPFGSTQWKLYSADSTSTTAARFYSNGVLLFSGAATPANGWGGTLNISGYQDTADAVANQETDCEIAELVAFNRRLTDVERAQIENYMRTKWKPITLFKPTDYAQYLTAWFDGSDAATVQLAGSGVNNWVNKGVGGMTLTQTTDAQRPSYNTTDKSVNFVAGQIMNPAGAPATYDVVYLSKPTPTGDWRTLLRSAQGHEVIIEYTSTRLGTYSAGFWPAIVSRVSPNNMTSDSAPAPYVTSQSSTLNNDPQFSAYKAFDGLVTNNYAHSGGPVTPAAPYWIKIDLGAVKNVAYYNYTARNESQDSVIPYQQWKSWTFEGSLDNAAWTLLQTVTSVANFGLGEKRAFTNTPASFRYWRWTVTEGTGYTPPYACAAELELYDALTWGPVWGLGFARVAASNAVVQSRDGGAVVSTVTALAAASAAPTMFGGYASAPPSQPWGAIKEIIFVTYNTDGMRQVLEGYLAWKDGKASLLPANHPYKSAAP